jgi:signal transduction histidine kinase
MWTLWPPGTPATLGTPASEPDPGAVPRSPGFVRRHPGLTAAALVVGLLLTNVGRIYHSNGRPDAAIPIISLAVVLPLLWRQRAPMLTFLISSIAAGVQWAVTGPLFVDLALLVSFYTVAATSSRRRTLLAAGILEFGVVIAVARYGQGSYALATLFLTGLVVAAGMLGINIQVRRAYLAEVEAKAARLEFERDQQGRLAVAAERNRIAREMHDIVAHNLSVMVALSDGASFTMVTDPGKAAEAVREASSVGRTALSELRRALAVLRDGDADTDDAAARTPTPRIADLDRLLAPIRRTGLDVSLTVEGPVGALSPGLQLTIYRLVQESLTNTVKHAMNADRSSVTIGTGTDATDVVVVDNGHGGSDPQRPAAGSGQGIIGMHERAAGHGGRVETGRTATGWMVRACFPVETAVAPLPRYPQPVGANP